MVHSMAGLLEGGQARGDLDLNLDRDRINAGEGEGGDAGDGHGGASGWRTDGL